MRAVLELARDGHGQLVVVSGDAGTGKSGLLAKLAEAAWQSGASVLRGRCSPTGQAIPFELAHQLIEPLSPQGSAAARATQLVTPGEPEAATAGEVMHALHLAVVAHARRQTCVLAVDDADLADPDSQRFLAHLVGRMDDLPLVLAVSLRDESGLLPELAANLTGTVATTRLPLLPLDREAVAEMVLQRMDWPDDALLEIVGQRTAGYPGLIRELLAEASEQASGGGERGGTIPAPSPDELAELVPDTLVRSVTVAFGRLDPAARDVAGVLAVLDDDTPLRLLAAAAGLTEVELLAVARRLSAAGLAWSAEVADQRRLAVRAPIVRDALVRAIGPEGIAVARTKAAFGLGTDALEAAARLLLAGPATGRADAAGLLRDAARRALQSGNAIFAATLLQRAAAEPVAEDARLEVEIERAAAEAVAGRFQAVAEHDALVSRLADPRARAAALERLADARFAADDRRRAAECYLRALAELPGDAHEEDRRRLEIRYAVATMQLSGLGQRSRERLVEQLSRGDVAFSPAFATRLAIDRVAAGAPAAHALYLAEWAIEQGLLTDPAAADLIPKLISGLVACDEVNDASALIRWVLESRSYTAPLKAATLTEQAQLQLLHGQLEAAAVSARTALRQPGPAAARATAHGALVRVLVEQGRISDAAGVLAEASAEAPDPESSLALLLAEGWLALGRGDLERALERFGDTRAVMQAAGILNPALCDAESGAVISLLRLGRTIEAGELAQEVLRRARSFGAPRALAASLRTAARVGELERAVPLLAEALRLLEDSPFELEITRCRVAYGATLRRLNRRADAREHLRLALDTAHRMGAKQLLERSRAELLATGARPRRPAITGRSALTPAERRVANLAAAGQGNRAIADDLFISIKTVEFHLHNVFIKLGVRSRAELRAAIEDADGAPAERYGAVSSRRIAG